MAVGDVVTDLQSITTTSYLTIQPGAGVEWVIHNIYGAADCEVSRYDGTDESLIDTSPTVGRWWSNLQLHLTNGQYLRIRNINAASKVIGYDGVVTK